MSESRKKATVLLDNPLEGEDILLEAMCGPAKPRRRREPKTAKPEHYRIVSISLYNEDIERLDRMVRELKRRGVYKANKSQLIRHALERLEAADFSRDDFDS
ncbi:MAG: hypothetical protein AAF654_00710 [Myxococcota bacterium]